MIMFKKLAALAAAGVLCATALVGCGGGDDFYKGKWVAVEMTSDGNTITADQAKDSIGMNLEDYLCFEFNDDGKAEVSFGGSASQEGTWKVDGDGVAVEVDGDSNTLKKDGDNIIFEPQEGVSVKLAKK